MSDLLTIHHVSDILCARWFLNWSPLQIHSAFHALFAWTDHVYVPHLATVYNFRCIPVIRKVVAGIYSQTNQWGDFTLSIMLYEQFVAELSFHLPAPSFSSALRKAINAGELRAYDNLWLEFTMHNSVRQGYLLPNKLSKCGAQMIEEQTLSSCRDGGFDICANSLTQICIWYWARIQVRRNFSTIWTIV